MQTMETKKQEAIRKAWLEFLSEEDFNRLIIDEEGFSNYQCRRYIHQSMWNDLYSRFKNSAKARTGSDLIYRPKSLAGIENNNGWVAIESDEDLPKDSYNYLVVCSNGSVKNLNDFEYYKKYIIPELSITHYQPIIKPLPPIY